MGGGEKGVATNGEIKSIGCAASEDRIRVPLMVPQVTVIGILMIVNGSLYVLAGTADDTRIHER